MKKFPVEICYHCNKKETLPEGIVDLVTVEVELEDYSDEEELFMPLCPECEKKWAKGGLTAIERKWKNEKNSYALQRNSSF